ncbi:Proline-rich receptor-like protein kinase PERK8, partial [Mucuna pruriens]
MEADPVKQEQEWIDRNQYEEERSLKLTGKNSHMICQRNADQLTQGGEDVESSPHEGMSTVTVIRNDMIDQMNPDQQIQEKQHIKGRFHIEEMGKKVDKQQKVSKDKKQMQGSCYEDLLNGNEAKISLENSKSSVCSICKSRRPNRGLQKKYTYEELEAATEGFSIKYSLSEGEYGPAFRGQLEDNQEIVIKQHAFTSLQEQKVFMTEFQVLINARHENVIMLLGSCIRLSQLLIVYEQACNGSLDRFLSRESGRSLSWGERVKVAVGVARGLKYLHESNIIHGGIKPSNILLNHEFKPLVGDFVFGKERCELKNRCKHKSMRNCGYTAPECQESGKLTTKADVYSFGVVLVELITGRIITDKVSGQKCLLECARSRLGGRKYLQLVDPKVSNSYDEQELVSLVHVAENCLRKNPKERFTMNMVVSTLPRVVDSNGIYVKEDFSTQNSNVSDITNLKGEEESLEGEDLGRENSEERGDNITCSRGNNEAELSQECDIYTTCGESRKTEEKEINSSTKVCWEGCLSYVGAREFYLEGAQEYTVCEEFFGWCDSI